MITPEWLKGISLVIKLVRDIMPIHSLTKFGDDPTNASKVINRKRAILGKIYNLRAITPESLERYPWLSNVSVILFPYTNWPKLVRTVKMLIKLMIRLGSEKILNTARKPAHHR